MMCADMFRKTEEKKKKKKKKKEEIGSAFTILLTHCTKNSVDPEVGPALSDPDGNVIILINNSFAQEYVHIIPALPLINSKLTAKQVSPLT